MHKIHNCYLYESELKKLEILKQFWHTKKDPEHKPPPEQENKEAIQGTLF